MIPCVTEYDQMSNSKHTDHTDYCTHQVLEHDRERMLCVMLAPQPARAALVALLAWNLEIAKVGEVASEQMIGLIRYQWWRDALDEIYAGKPLRQHAVVLALADAIAEYNLPQEAFLDIISAREADLDRAPFLTLAALDSYACTTGGSLLTLWLHILKVEDRHAFDAVEYVGTAWALIGSLRACHHAAHSGKVRLPADMLQESGIDADKILQEGFTSAVSEAVQAVAEMAEEHIRDARALRKDLPKAALPALYLAVQAEDFLHRLKQCGYNPASPKMERGRAPRALKLWWANALKRY
jgi:phytoene synthase